MKKNETVIMCPGQGSQYVGMGKELYESFSYLKPIMEEASLGAGVDLRRLCFEGPEAELKQTEFTQPCLLVVSAMAGAVLREECGVRGHYFLGHSLGEYSALVLSGRLPLFDAARIVRARGRAMQRAVPLGVGGMMAVMGAPEGKLKELCALASQMDSGSEALQDATKEVKEGAGRLSGVWVANYNSDGQLVVSGALSSLKLLKEIIAAESQKEGGAFKKVRLIDLPVSAPFHSPLMQPARDELSPMIEGLSLSGEGLGEMLPNVLAEPRSYYQKSYLASQMDGAVLWRQSMERVYADGGRCFLEVGAGKVLSTMAKKILEPLAASKADGHGGDIKIFSMDPFKEFLSAFSMSKL